MENGSVMEYLYRHPEANTPRRKLQLLMDICGAMDYLHEHGIVHTDLKPNNMLVDKQGRLFITDFGFAKVCSYMPPERLALWFWNSPVTHNVSTRAGDIYSFGISLYEIWSRQPAFQWSTRSPEEQQAVYSGIIGGTLRPDTTLVSDMPQELQLLMKQCWAANPDSRPKGFGVLFDAISKLLEALPEEPVFLLQTSSSVNTVPAMMETQNPPKWRELTPDEKRLPPEIQEAILSLSNGSPLELDLSAKFVPHETLQAEQLALAAFEAWNVVFQKRIVAMRQNPKPLLAFEVIAQDNERRRVDLENNRAKEEVERRHNLDDATMATRLRPLCDALSANRSLLVLNFAYNRITDPGMRVFADVLRRNGALRSLDLSRNKISGEGGASLGDGLRANMCLSVLDLSSNALGDSGARWIAEALKENSTLSELNLGGCGIGNEGSKVLGEALKLNKGLKALRIERNRIGDAGLVALIDAITMCRMESLSLSNQQSSIGSETIEAIAESLSRTNLKTFKFNVMEIGDDGARAFALALKSNKTIENLHLELNKIGSGGAVHLGEMLRNNETLQKLFLHRNNIRPTGARAIGEALAFNTRLSILDIRENSIGGVLPDSGETDEHTGIHCIADALKANGTLQYLGIFEYDMKPEMTKYVQDVIESANRTCTIFDDESQILDVI
ncbi:RNI-like protein [Gonapodya prolifera JEL478]|uniref:RNI-like protein n=1 Tax=Gonapodya prolifera (strain JEL478) TaxID=1344416 RepID=A0A139A013_GONPJ|nr:RNI-like protein [Gonapodya prolifera JEL478]|eukprot:KXS10099.1 RNI-like protein [Gonapodya prolifera JEL478]